MITQLEREVAKLKHGDHICPVYESLDQQLAVAAPFVKNGIANGDHIVYASGDSGLKRISEALARAGIDVDRECRRGALRLVNTEHAPRMAGKFDPKAIIGRLRDSERAALAAGFSGIRFIGDMNWFLGRDLDGDDLIEYEAMLTPYVAQSRAVVLCQYDRTLSDPALIHDILRVHPIAILGDHVCQNPYCEPPELILRQEQMARDEYKRKRVDWWINRLQEVAKRDQEAQRVQQQMESLLESAGEGICGIDQDGRCTFMNHAAAGMLGYDPQEPLGKNLHDLIAHHRQDGSVYPVQECPVFRGFQRNESCRADNEVFWRKDGVCFPVEYSSSPIIENGVATGGVITFADTTERKNMESRLIRSQRMESIGALAGGIAHDLNNILTPILMSIAVLRHRVTDPKSQRVLETIEVSSKRGADIVRQVLSFARGLEGARIEVQPKRLFQDIKTIIEDTFPKNIRLELKAASGSWGILGDATQLLQVLLNLCVNARDAMPDGGSLVITGENTEMDSQYASMYAHAKPGRYVTIGVTDSGTGISPSIIDKIFEPFFTTKESGKGTGLGLSTAMAIVRGHDGFMNVSSEPGQGTTFKIWLPAAGGARERNKEIVPEAAPRGKGETILVVDDEASILAITSQTLEAFGYQTLMANDGVEAVTIYARSRDEIAAVLTDISMPIMDGGTTIRVLLKMNPDIKIIAASGKNAEGSAARDSDASVKEFLSKPYTAETLLKALRRVLDEN